MVGSEDRGRHAASETMAASARATMDRSRGAMVGNFEIAEREDALEEKRFQVIRYEISGRFE
jgi:hypothetical protein